MYFSNFYCSTKKRAWPICSWDDLLFYSRAFFCLFYLLAVFMLGLRSLTFRHPVAKWIIKISFSPGLFPVCPISCQGLWTVERRLLPASPGVKSSADCSLPDAADLSGVHTYTSLFSQPLVPSQQQRSEGRRQIPVVTPAKQLGIFLTAFTNKMKIMPSWNERTPNFLKK